MADTVNIQTDVWAALVSDTLSNVQNIMNVGYNLFEDTGSIAGKELGSFNWVLDASLGGDMENVATDDTELTPTKIAQKALHGIVLRRGKTIKETGLRKLLTGEGLNTAIAMDLMNYLALQMAKDLASTLKGGFAGTNASNVIIDLSDNVGDTAMLTHDQFPTIISTAYPNLNPGVVKTLIVHSDVYNNIRANLTQGFTIQDTIINNLKIPNLLGLNIISNNQLCAKTAGADGAPDTYTSYMCWDKAFMRDMQRPMDLYRDFYPKIGGGTTEISFYENFAIAPKNLSWKTAPAGSPSRTALETGANWEWLAHDYEQVPIRQIVSTIVPTVASEEEVVEGEG